MNQAISISDLLTPEDLPKEFSFLETSVNNFLQDVKYDFHEVAYSADNTTVSHTLRIVTENEFGFTIPGLGFRLILNPSGANTSGFWCNISIYRGILSFFNSFNPSDFDGSLVSVQKIITEIFKVDGATLYLLASSEFESGGTKSLDGFNRINDYCLLKNVYDTNKTEYDNFSTLSNDIFDNSSHNSWEIIFNLYINKSGLTAENVKERTATIISKIQGPLSSLSFSDLISSLRDMMLPKISMSVELALGLEIPRKYLIPIKTNGDIETDESKKLILTIAESLVTFNSEKGLAIENDIAVSFPSAYPLAQIGNTGIKLSFTNARLINEGNEKGLFVSAATLQFPAFWNHNDGNSTAVIKGKNLLIDTSGFSGLLSLEAKSGVTTSPLINFDLGGFTLSIAAFALNFHQNSITDCAINGTLKFPSKYKKNGQDALLDVEVMINENGDFKITAIDNPNNNALNFKFLDVFNFDILSLSFGRTNNKFYADMAANLSFEGVIANIPNNILPKNIAVKKLRVWEDGSIEFEAGGLSIPTSFSMKIGPVAMTVSGLHFGSIEQYGRKYNYFGFDGNVNINPGGVDAKGNGIKFYYTVDDAPATGNTAAKLPDSYLRIDGIAIDMRFPSDAKSEETADTVIKGFLSVTDVTPSTASPTQNAKRPESEYAGGVPNYP